MNDIILNIEVDDNPKIDNKEQNKQIRNRFIIQIIFTLIVVGFCIYSIITEGQIPTKDNLIYALLSAVIGIWIPSPKVLK